MNANEQAVAAVLAEYQDALNQSDTDAVMKLYAFDGVFMPQHFPSSVGADAVRKAYLAVFEAITLTVEFKVAEVLQIAPDWAIARTNSAGTAKVNATGDGRPGGKSGTLRVSEDQRRLENCALLLLHHESTKTLDVARVADHRPPDCVSVSQQKSISIRGNQKSYQR